MICSKNRIFLILSLLSAEVYYSNSNENCLNEKENCTKNVYENLLIFTTPTKIKMLNLTTNELRVIQTYVECSTLTASNDFVYYTKFRDDSKSLYKTSITSRITSAVLSWNTPITSVAIDYITNNIYFTTETSLLVCNKEDKKACKHVVCYDARYVALAPRSGIMFYTRKAPRGNKRYILKSNMDGSDEDIVIDGRFSDPFSLTVVESTETLYWVEREANKTHSIQYNQNNSRMISYQIEGNESIGPIAVYKNKILFAKNDGYVIDSLDTIRGQSSMFYPDISTLSVELLYAFNPLERNIYKMDNPCNANHCLPNDICLLKPSSTPKKVEFSCLDQVPNTCV